MLKLAKHTIVWFFPLNQVIIYEKNDFLEGKISLEHKCILNCSYQIFVTNYKGDDSWQLEIPNPPKKINLWIIFSKRKISKKTRIWNSSKIFCLFFANFFSSSLKDLFISPSISLNNKMIYIYMFSQRTCIISCVIYA